VIGDVRQRMQRTRPPFPFVPAPVYAHTDVGTDLLHHATALNRNATQRACAHRVLRFLLRLRAPTPLLPLPPIAPPAAKAPRRRLRAQMRGDSYHRGTCTRTHTHTRARTQTHAGNNLTQPRTFRFFLPDPTVLCMHTHMWVGGVHLNSARCAS